MFNTDELVIEKIQSCELWEDVPHYEKLDVIHCVLCLIPNPYDSIREYLKRRKEHNKKYRKNNAEKIKEYKKQYRKDLKRRKEHNKRYKEFWDNADKVTFNDDRSMYRAALMTKLLDE